MNVHNFFFKLLKTKPFNGPSIKDVKCLAKIIGKYGGIFIIFLSNNMMFPLFI